MTPNDLRAWQQAMGYTQHQAAEALGVTRATYRDWITGQSRTTGKPVEIDRRTALACAALAAGLAPLGLERSADRDSNPVNPQRIRLFTTLKAR